MKALEIKRDPRMAERFKDYPAPVRRKLKALRQLIIEVAKNTPEILSLEETLKWGEPSYISKIGSTIRIDWKEKTPDQYAIYFKCTSKLVPSFKKAFPKTFNYEANRAIVFQMDDKIPEAKLKKCIKAALTYHKVKSLPGLGVK